MIIAWVLFMLVSTLFSFYYRFYLVDIYALKNYNRVFAQKIEEILRMSYAKYLEKKSGSIYKNFDRGVGTQLNFPFFIFNHLIKSFLSIVFIFFLLLWIDWKMTFISLSLVPVMVYFGVFFHKKTSRHQKEINE